MVRKKDLNINVCSVCKFRPKLRRVESFDLVGGLSGEKWYEIRCQGFGHSIVAHHRGKSNAVQIWNTINPGGVE